MRDGSTRGSSTFSRDRRVQDEPGFAPQTPDSRQRSDLFLSVRNITVEKRVENRPTDVDTRAHNVVKWL